MSPLTHLRRWRLPLAAVCASAVSLTLAITPAPAVQVKGQHFAAEPKNAIMESLSAVPTVKGPIAETANSYMFSTMEKAREPFDVRDYGYVEKEYFLSGTANVYSNKSGSLEVTEEDVPYTNRILVRRPANPQKSSGIVLVDILNASNGYDVEDHWRRMWQHAMEQGHTYIGVTSKPLNVDALKNFDPERYDELSWYTDPGAKDDRVIADPEHPEEFNPFMVVEGAEEGLAWDIITQVGTLLNSNQARRVLGGQTADTVLLMGQSQSGIYLNTWTSNFHKPAKKANSGNIFDGYLNSVGAVLERPLAQDPEGDPGLHLLPGDEPKLDTPFITVTSEGGASLFGTEVIAKNPDLPANRRHWQVPGTAHTDLTSPVIPAKEEILKSGRLPRNMDPEFIDALNPYPLEPAIIAAMEALIDWTEEGKPAAPSKWFDIEDGQLVRDEHDNATGGVRYGLIEYPLASFKGAASTGAVYGSYDLISAEEFKKTYGSREAYLSRIRASNAKQIKAGYLTQSGAEMMLETANMLLDELGI